MPSPALNAPTRFSGRRLSAEDGHENTSIRASEPSWRRTSVLAAAEPCVVFNYRHGKVTSAGRPRLGTSSGVIWEHPRCALLPAVFSPRGIASKAGDWEAVLVCGRRQSLPSTAVCRGARGEALPSRHHSPQSICFGNGLFHPYFLRPAMPPPSGECHQLITDPRRCQPGAVTHPPFWWSMQATVQGLLKAQDRLALQHGGVHRRLA